MQLEWSFDSSNVANICRLAFICLKTLLLCLRKTNDYNRFLVTKMAIPFIENKLKEGRMFFMVLSYELGVINAKWEHVTQVAYKRLKLIGQITVKVLIQKDKI